MVHLYLPWAREVLHPECMHASVPLWPQSLQWGSFLCPHVYRCDGEGKYGRASVATALSMWPCAWEDSISFRCPTGPLFHCPWHLLFFLTILNLCLDNDLPVPCTCFLTAWSVQSQNIATQHKGCWWCFAASESSPPALKLCCRPSLWSFRCNRTLHFATLTGRAVVAQISHLFLTSYTYQNKSQNCDTCMSIQEPCDTKCICNSNFQFYELGVSGC